MADVDHAIRVRSVPATHPYVRAVVPTGSHGDPAPGGPITVDLAPDPVVDVADPVRWWPHPALDPAWTDPARPHLVHVHFGYEHRTPEVLRSLVDRWRCEGVALVVTVHDLHNPHEVDRGPHLARTAVLVRAADRVLTLTRPAADEIRSRWAVEARVVPHPPVVPPEHPARERARGRSARLRSRTLAVHLKNGRASVDPVTPLEGMLAHLGSHTDDRAVAYVHPELLEPGHPRAGELDHEVLDRWRRHPRAEFVVRTGVDDDTLYTELAGTDIVVLPYRFGTHSGWLELCRDLGVATAIPDVGHLVGQAGEGDPNGPPMRTYPVADPHGLAGCLAGLRADLDGRVRWVAGADDVRRRLAEAASAHRWTYAVALGRHA